MKVRIGVIGPSDSVNRIQLATKEFSHIDFITFIYEKTEEVATIIEKNKDTIDQWLFSGQAPYHYALNLGLIDEIDGSYPPLHGSSLFGSLLEGTVKTGKILQRISIDTILEHEIELAFNTHSLKNLTYYAFPYEGYKPARKLIDFHRSMYEAGKIDVAFTCIKVVELELQKIGIPCFRIIPTNLAIQMIVHILEERAYSLKYRKSQIAIVGFETISTPADYDHYFSFDYQRHELELRKYLIDFSEQVSGSLMQLGDGLFFVFTTRGELELYLHQNSLFTFLHQVEPLTNLRVRIGIGYGATVIEAEDHVRKAFKQARQHPMPVIVSVNENQEIKVMEEADQEIHFSSRVWGTDWQEKFKHATISPTIVSKVLSFASYYQKNLVSSQDIARWLNSTERNGRRILQEMERLQLAKLSGEEQSGSRGRPRKLYKLVHGE
ncbi:hypothetical protein [Bacillus kwashiorkori]|uniref:hypothetical protein n=1 Tax=Bacillus kwashiorkori TaxID=1522318 RepID=UPI0007855491|nr:hypothetical protein [Bacillus kwashiorkori]